MLLSGWKGFGPHVRGGEAGAVLTTVGSVEASSGCLRVYLLNISAHKEWRNDAQEIRAAHFESVG